MNKTNTATDWTPRHLMLLALFLHLVSLPFPYSKGIAGSGFLSTSRPSDQAIYDRTGSRTLAHDSSYGVNYNVTTTAGIAGKTGLQWMPGAILIIPGLIFVFWVLEPKLGFWHRRRAYLIGFVLLLCCGATYETYAGRFALAGLAVGVYAVYRRFILPPVAPIAAVAEATP